MSDERSDLEALLKASQRDGCTSAAQIWMNQLWLLADAEHQAPTMESLTRVDWRAERKEPAP